MATVNVDTHGPVFDGRAAQATDEFTAAAVEEVARVGKNDVLGRLGQVLRDPTPYYETRIRTDRVTPERWLVNDGPHTFKYGPWLEGTGSRNFPVTRFKGYRTFLIIGRALNAKAGRIAEGVLRRYLDRMR